MSGWCAGSGGGRLIGGERWCCCVVWCDWVGWLRDLAGRLGRETLCIGDLLESLRLSCFRCWFSAS